MNELKCKIINVKIVQCDTGASFPIVLFLKLFYILHLNMY